MPRWAALCGFVVLVLVGGILAGQGVHSSLARAEPQSAVASDSDDTSEDSTQPDCHDPHSVTESPVPCAVVLNDDGRDAHAATLVSRTVDASTLSEVRTDASSLDKGVLQLIQKTFPNADPETAKIWAESYSDMDFRTEAIVVGIIGSPVVAARRNGIRC